MYGQPAGKIVHRGFGGGISGYFCERDSGAHGRYVNDVAAARLDHAFSEYHAREKGSHKIQVEYEPKGFQIRSEKSPGQFFISGTFQNFRLGYRFRGISAGAIYQQINGAVGILNLFLRVFKILSNQHIRPNGKRFFKPFCFQLFA